MLAAFFSAAAVAGTPAAATAAGNCLPAANWPADRADLAAQVITLVNAHRSQLGLVPLVVSPTLTAAAEWKARNMAAYYYLDHDDPAPDARTADERVLACGYPATQWGENIGTGYPTAEAVVGAWLASPSTGRTSSAPSTAPPASASRARRRCTGRSPSAPSPTRAAWPPRPWRATVRPPPRPRRRTAPAVAAHRSGTKRPVRVTCAQRGHGVACRVSASAE